ncbi:MAG: hypothetical protein FD146_2061 [Anaerolineaceae bacterium]|nr:MAG: hypothetical protein FD146_2061 [Anaerolineaceae bacterium]
MITIVADTTCGLPRETMTRLGLPVYELPPAIVVHGGPGALAVGFFVSA